MEGLLAENRRDETDDCKVSLLLHATRLKRKQECARWTGGVEILTVFIYLCCCSQSAGGADDFGHKQQPPFFAKRADLW